jgi:hypothetical protein
VSLYFHVNLRNSKLLNSVNILICMYVGEFEAFFGKISQMFTLESAAKKQEVAGKLLKRSPSDLLWNTLDDIHGYDAIDIGKSHYISCENFFRKPMRILFFILIHEIESRLYRVHRWSGKPLNELDSWSFNDMIRVLLEREDLFSLQKTYASRAEFKEDLKAVSAFRNVIVHTNRKLLKHVDADTLINRKKQCLQVLFALQEILDKMERKSYD